jgi:hypothetical protein
MAPFSAGLRPDEVLGGRFAPDLSQFHDKSAP